MALARVLCGWLSKQPFATALSLLREAKASRSTNREGIIGKDDVLCRAQATSVVQLSTSLHNNWFEIRIPLLYVHFSLTVGRPAFGGARIQRPDGELSEVLPHNDDVSTTKLISILCVRQNKLKVFMSSKI